MYIKTHESYRNVVALCDKELAGKKFEQGKMQLDVRENFYKGEEVNEETAIFKLKSQALEDATFNIVGKKSIAAAIKAGIIEKDNFATIQGIPFTLVLV